MLDADISSLTSAAPAIGVALGVGLLIGLERERIKGDGPNRAAAGVRTFAITALLGALAAITGETVVLGVAGAGVVLLAVASYLHTRESDPGLTTEVALLATFVVGIIAAPHPMLAAAVGVVLALLLALRGMLHSFARHHLSDQELRDGLVLAAAALIILPVLPEEPIDPWGAINLRLVWRLTLIIMLINAGGYVLQRLVGIRWGLPLAGLLGGFASSTATIASMAQHARRQPRMHAPAAAGAALSSVPTVIQFGVILAVTDASLLRALAWPLAAMGAVGVTYGALITVRSMTAHDESEDTAHQGRAFSLRTAVLFAGLFCVIAILVTLLQKAFGSAGALAGAVTGGFLDAHPSAASVAGLAREQVLAPAVAATAIGLIASANTLSKLVFARTGGAGFFWRVAPGLLLMLAAFWVVHWALPMVR